MTKTAGPMVSSSIAERIPPWTKPAGLQNSFLPSNPILIQPSLGLASSRCQPSSLDDGGAARSSSAVLIIGGFRSAADGARAAGGLNLAVGPFAAGPCRPLWIGPAQPVTDARTAC